MSKLEESIATKMDVLNIPYQQQKSLGKIPVPWSAQLQNQIVDMYIPSISLFIEIKGFMTIEAMMKKNWLAQYMMSKGYNYYLLQGTEKDWSYSLGLSERSIPRNIDFQILEILCLYTNGLSWHTETTINRINLFLYKKLLDYRKVTNTIVF